MSFPRTKAMALITISVGALGLVACSSSSSTSSNSSGGAQDPGQTANTTPTGTETNPYGYAYPTSGLGFKARNNPQATIPGDKIKNFKFLGYVNSDRSKGLTTISLADFYDPLTKQYKLLHLSVAGVWCTWCVAEVKAVVPLIPDLQAKGVIYVTALSENNEHGPAAQSDLDYWVQAHQTNFTQVLDPGNRELGPFFTSAGIPWNGNIDARTMEILSSITSAPTSDGTTIDIWGDVNPWLDWIAQNPVTPPPAPTGK